MAKKAIVSLRDSKPVQKATILNKQIYWNFIFSLKSFLSWKRNVQKLNGSFSKDSPPFPTHVQYMRCGIIVLCAWYIQGWKLVDFLARQQIEYIQFGGHPAQSQPDWVKIFNLRPEPTRTNQNQSDHPGHTDPSLLGRFPTHQCHHFLTVSHLPSNLSSSASFWILSVLLGWFSEPLLYCLPVSLLLLILLSWFSVVFSIKQTT